MNPKQLLAPKEHPVYADIALLLIRLVMGAAFMIHGWGKIQDPFGWQGPDGFAPGIFQALAAVSEFGGGAALILGLLTPAATLGIASTMIVAVHHHAIRRGDPFVSQGGGAYELAAVYLCIALLVMAIGPGRLSLDRLIFGRKQPAKTSDPATNT